jgi:uncharacterized protein YkwD
MIVRSNMKKYIPVLSITLAVALFAVTAKPDTIVSSNAQSINGTQFNFTMPTMRPIRDFNFYTSRTAKPASTPNTAVAPATAKPVQSTQTSTPATPTATPAPVTNQVSQPTTSGSLADQVITLVNNERSKVGLGALTKNSALTKSAEDYALRMGQYNFFGHTGNDGSTFITRNTSAGYTNYRWMGENIAAGQRTPEEVMRDWMNSPGHKANIVNTKAKEIGVGYAKVSGSTYGTYWVQEFGAR